MMRAVISGTVLTLGCSFSAFSQEELKGCDAKEFAVEQQLEYAKVQGKKQHIEGLERALASVQSECLREESRQKSHAEIKESTHKEKLQANSETEWELSQ
ncbi:DUF1090 domain-containing protein [Vibrio sp. J1-1]|uniref:DUF1090 family protein n=1 Tax=Vibrio sp. J1-1 TaxID=2912251 RepID=UPI001F2A264E|nr:DUF1090 family protein [Vibrio sp. J1-1]MBR9875189.1 DUF1090 domain-containing protein [Vibrionaceae bacterium]MCF7482137.1 DUF1090 domain-containing protein [Vibrio sp. J1-1]